MFVDSSALVAIFAVEPDGRSYRDTIAAGRSNHTSALVVVETVMVLSKRMDLPPPVTLQRVLRFLEEASVEIMPIQADHAVLGVETFAIYGKGRGHPAQLNLADCLTYACARSKGLPILYKGNDFALTDMGAPAGE